MSVTAQTPLLMKLMSSSVAIASHAGNIIREVMSKGELGIVQKEHANDLQTEADRSAQRSIVASLEKFFPKITIIGEEEKEDLTGVAVCSDEDPRPLTLQCPKHLSTLKEEEIVMWVDPLDGTSEYTQGLLDHVTVLIGIATGGKAIAGVIHQPYYNYQNPGAELGRTLWGVVGSGVGGMTIQDPPADRRIVCTTRSHSSSTVNDAITSVNPDEVLRVGGAGHKVMLLLDGHAHAYVFASPGCKKWDTCGPQAILEAAGGVLTDISGNIIPYHASAPHRNSTGVLAVSPKENHTQILDMIPKHVKENLKA